MDETLSVSFASIVIVCLAVLAVIVVILLAWVISISHRLRETENTLEGERRKVAEMQMVLGRRGTPRTARPQQNLRTSSGVQSAPRSATSFGVDDLQVDQDAEYTIPKSQSRSQIDDEAQRRAAERLARQQRIEARRAAVQEREQRIAAASQRASGREDRSYSSQQSDLRQTDFPRNGQPVESLSSSPSQETSESSVQGKRASQPLRRTHREHPRQSSEEQALSGSQQQSQRQRRRTPQKALSEENPKETVRVRSRSGTVHARHAR